MEAPHQTSDTCAEAIAGETTVHENVQQRNEQPCGLPAEDYCATCRYNVCRDHINSRHDRHSRTSLPLSDANEASVGERRSGDERRRG